ncbi:MAG: hypothetical protein EPN26_03465 [Rhodospirillales bacterium]|nr:MAG: hypothetical protein EPN26_03465 [Rhodospirillales bacterium]
MAGLATPGSLAMAPAPDLLLLLHPEQGVDILALAGPMSHALQDRCGSLQNVPVRDIGPGSEFSPHEPMDLPFGWFHEAVKEIEKLYDKNNTAPREPREALTRPKDARRVPSRREPSPSEAGERRLSDLVTDSLERSSTYGVMLLGPVSEVAEALGMEVPKPVAPADIFRDVSGTPSTRSARWRRTRERNGDKGLILARAGLEQLCARCWQDPAKAVKAIENRLLKGRDADRLARQIVLAPEILQLDLISGGRTPDTVDLAVAMSRLKSAYEEADLKARKMIVNHGTKEATPSSTSAGSQGPRDHTPPSGGAAGSVRPEAKLGERPATEGGINSRPATERSYVKLPPGDRV